MIVVKKNPSVPRNMFKISLPSRKRKPHDLPLPPILHTRALPRVLHVRKRTPSVCLQSPQMGNHRACDADLREHHPRRVGVVRVRRDSFQQLRRTPDIVASLEHGDGGRDVLRERRRARRDADAAARVCRRSVCVCVCVRPLVDADLGEREKRGRELGGRCGCEV